MAQHNQTRHVGFLIQNPTILNEGLEGNEKVIMQLRTIRRNIEGYNDKQFEDVIVYYDGTEFIDKMKALKQFDLIDIKGVFNILTVDKSSICPICGHTNVKYKGSSTFIYPISFSKLNNVQGSFEYDENLPETILRKHYKEVSNQVLIVGTVCSKPEMISNGKLKCCRYKLGVDRKYYIKTQTELTADYPWVYSYGKQAERDYRHLKEGSVVLVDSFIHTRQVDAKITCEKCGTDYTYPDVVTDFIPYSVEYFSNYKTDEDIALEEELKKRELIGLMNS